LFHHHPLQHHHASYRYLLSKQQRQRGISHFGSAERLRVALSRAITSELQLAPSVAAAFGSSNVTDKQLQPAQQHNDINASFPRIAWQQQQQPSSYGLANNNAVSYIGINALLSYTLCERPSQHNHAIAAIAACHRCFEADSVLLLLMLLLLLQTRG
jgi:hypothetical protein